MRRLDGIYESVSPPNNNVLWLDKGVAKYFRNGAWSPIGGDISPSWYSINDKPDFAAVATSGSYNDLWDRPAEYVLPAATRNELGGILVSDPIPDIDITEEVTAESVAITLNTLLTSLRYIGVLAP